MDWLTELETQVARLLGELTEIRRTNRNLSARVKKLEKAERASDGGRKLEQERAEVRRRVERLASRLEALAGETED